MSHGSGPITTPRRSPLFRATPDRAASLPSGIELYRLGADGRLLLTTADGTRNLGDDPSLLPFIDDGQRAHYLIGHAGSGPDSPSGATVKIGVVAPHSAFSPHVHGAEHVVLSLGSASCTVVDDGRVIELALPPGCLVRIPAWLPHAFGNRATQPLLILAANTGLGTAHDDYAVKAADAERRSDAVPSRSDGSADRSDADASRSDGDADWARIAADLRVLDGHRIAPPGVRERLAAGLRMLAQRVDRAGPL